MEARETDVQTAGMFPQLSSQAVVIDSSFQITAIEKLGLSNLRLCVTGSSGDPDWIVEDLAPDISCYHNDTLTTDYRERQMKNVDGKGTADFAVADLALEVKPKHSYDAFNDPKEGEDLATHTFVNDSKGAQRVLGQMCAYAAAQLGMAFRTHCFSVFITGNTARLIRWDRAGAVVSKSFNYIKESGLAEFFKRYDLLPQALRGWDQTAIPLPLDSPETIEAQNALISGFWFRIFRRLNPRAWSQTSKKFAEQIQIRLSKRANRSPRNVSKPT